MKKRSKALGATAAGLLAAVAVATPASASTYTVTNSEWHVGDLCVIRATGCDGSASFVRDGEHLLVWDNNSDGHSVVVRYQRSDDLPAIHDDWNHYGYLKRLDINMDIPESGWISYEVCLGDYNGSKANAVTDFDTCSNWLLEDAS